MKPRSRLLLVVLLGLTPVLLRVTLRYGESTWLVPAGVLPLLLLGPTRILLWSLLSGAVFWIGLLALSRTTQKAEWRARWCTVRGLALLSLAGVVLVVGSLAMLSAQSGILTPSWAGAAASGWFLFLLSLTRDAATEPRGALLLLLRLWLLFSLLPALYAFAFGTLAGLCC